jgi:hypothetical protein
MGEDAKTKNKGKAKDMLTDEEENYYQDICS